MQSRKFSRDCVAAPPLRVSLVAARGRGGGRLRARLLGLLFVKFVARTQRISFTLPDTVRSFSHSLDSTPGPSECVRRGEEASWREQRHGERARPRRPAPSRTRRRPESSLADLFETLSPSRRWPHLVSLPPFRPPRRTSRSSSRLRPTSGQSSPSLSRARLPVYTDMEHALQLQERREEDGSLRLEAPRRRSVSQRSPDRALSPVPNTDARSTM